MKRNEKIYNWLVTIGFWLLVLCTPCSAYGQQYGTLYKGVSTYRGSYASVPTYSAPTYEFQSTSAYGSSLSTYTYTSKVYEPFAPAPYVEGGMRRDIWSDEDHDPDTDDNALGIVDDPAPVGEPWILLLFVLLYLIYTVYKKKIIFTK